MIADGCRWYHIDGDCPLIRSFASSKLTSYCKHIDREFGNLSKKLMASLRLLISNQSDQYYGYS